jgi:hypothetical protein
MAEKYEKEIKGIREEMEKKFQQILARIDIKKLVDT